MNLIGAKVRELRKRRGLTILDLANLVGSDVGNISRLERGLQGYSPALLTKIAGALDVTVDSLFSDTPTVETIRHSRNVVPIISWVTAGGWADISDPFQAGHSDEWVPAPPKASDRMFALRVRGDSMLNIGGDLSFADGDIIYVDPDRAAIHRSLVIVKLVEQDAATFKRLLVDGDQRMIEALNPAWPTRIAQLPETAQICGVVVARLDTFV